MRPRYLILIALAIIIIAFGIWWFKQPALLIPVKSAGNPMSARADDANPVTPKSQADKPVGPNNAQVAAPNLPPATPGTANPASGSIVPQAELKSAIQDLARLARNGDTLTLYETYTLPDEIDPQKIQMIQATRERLEQTLNTFYAKAAALYPDKLDQLKQELQQTQQQSHEKAAQVWESLESQVPILNAAGDEATYQLNQVTGLDRENYNTVNGSGPPVSVVFIKVNGMWYLKQPESSN